MVTSAVRDILDQVSIKTGVPVEIVEDTSIPVLATVTMARPGLPFHLVKVNPRRGLADYHVAFQCGFILRQATLPLDQRWQFGASSDAMPSVNRMISGPGGLAKKLGLNAATSARFSEQMVSGLLTQLRSVPIGIRIDNWLATDYPELRDLQRESILMQAQENTAVFSPQIREISPPTIWRANVSMNAAYSSVAQKLLNEPQLLIPYRAAGMLEESEPLVHALSEVTDGPQGDQELVKSWSTSLGLSDWIAFVPATRWN